MKFELALEDGSIEEKIAISKDIIKDAYDLIKAAYSKNARFSDIKTASTFIYQQFIPKCIKDYLHKNEIANFNLLIDSRLYWIPFEMAYNGANFFCNIYQTSRNISLLVKQDASAITLEYPIKVGIIVDPNDDLKSARKEGLKLQKTLGKLKNNFIVKIIAGERVTKSTFREFFEFCDIVHFAGHVEIKPVVGFKLADGIITINEIAKYLKTPFLIFANACNSIKIIDSSLARKLKNFIGTFTEVEDTSSLNFALQLYKYIAVGMNIGKAIYLIRKEIYKNQGAKDLAWANYFYHGNPDARIIHSELMENIPGYKNFAAALNHFRAHQFGTAKKMFVKAIDEGYNKDIIYTYLGMIFFLKEDEESAFPFFKKALELNPRNSKAHFWMGKFYRNNNKEGLAEQEFLKVLKGNYDYLTSGLLLKEVTEKKTATKDYFRKKCGKLIEEANISLEKSYNIDNHLGLGILYSLNGESGKAIEIFQDVLQQNERYIDVHILLAGEYEQNNLIENAITELQTLRQVDTGNFAVFNKLAKLYYNHGMYKECADVMEEGLKLSVINSNYYFNLGNVYCMLGDPKNSLKHYLTAVKIEPDFADACYNIANIYQKENKIDDAEKYYYKTLELQPDNYAALNNLGVILGKQGRFLEARKYLEKSIMTGTDSNEDEFSAPFINLEILNKKRITAKDFGKNYKHLKGFIIILGIVILILLYLYIVYFFIK